MMVSKTPTIITNEKESFLIQEKIIVSTSIPMFGLCQARINLRNPVLI